MPVKCWRQALQKTSSLFTTLPTTPARPVLQLSLLAQKARMQHTDLSECASSSWTLQRSRLRSPATSRPGTRSRSAASRRLQSIALAELAHPISSASCPGGNTISSSSVAWRSVLLPAPVTMVWPSGETARYSTRNVCPVRVASLAMAGYRHTMIWFWLYPCVLTISLTFLLHDRLHTWLPARMQWRSSPANARIAGISHHSKFHAIGGD